MSNLVVQSTPDGLNIPSEVMEQAGLRPGRLLELIPLPDAEEIQRLASRHTVWSLGDCIRVALPRWSEGVWIVDLLSHDGREHIGSLFYDAHGHLDDARSTTRETLR